MTAEEKLNIDIPEVQAIIDILLSKFIPDEDDMHQMKEEMEIMVQRMLVKHLTCFANLDPVLLNHIPHEYQT